MVRKKINSQKNKQIFQIIKIATIAFLLCTTVITGQRTDHEETYTSYTEMPEYTIRFYNTTGNDSVYIFDSDQHGTHILLLNGTDQSATFYGNVIAPAFHGDGGNLTNLSAGNPFNQDLNTTNSSTFASLLLNGNLDMNHNDINNAFDIECENDLSVGNDIKLHDKLEYDGGGTTHLDFNPNQIILTAGGTNILDMISTLATFGVNVTINENLTITEFNTAGFVKNDASGKLSGGNTIDISTDTNLGGTPPININGDNVEISQSGAASDGYLTSSDWNNFTTAYNWGNLWNRSGTTLYPATDGDNVQINTTTGTAPIVVASTTKVTNLNADLLDGLHVGTTFAAIPDISATNLWSGAQSFLNSYTYFSYRLVHSGDTNTYMQFTTDQIDFYAGSLKMMSIDESSIDRVIVNPNLYNINFQVNGDHINNVIATDPTNDMAFFGGGVQLNLIRKTANYTMARADNVVICDGTLTITLDDAGVTGQIVTIKNYGTGVVTVDGHTTETIDGQLTQTLSNQYDSISLIAEKGIGWHITSRI